MCHLEIGSTLSRLISNLVAFFYKHGFTGSLGTNVDQEYFAEAKLGDAIYEDAIIEEISEQKATVVSDTESNLTDTQRSSENAQVFDIDSQHQQQLSRWTSCWL